MPRNLEELLGEINTAISPAFRGRLVQRGLARGLVWNAGVLPSGAPQFSHRLSGELIAYGLGLFRLALSLRDADRNHALLPNAFERAAEAIEAVVRNGDPAWPERGFYTMIASSAYHLGHFSARAFSLFGGTARDLNLSPSEAVLRHLLVRDITGLHAALVTWAQEGIGFDAALARKLDQLSEGLDFNNALHLALTTLFHRAVAQYDHALEASDAASRQAALDSLNEGTSTAAEFRHVPFYWLYTIARHLLDDLWDHCLHVRLPMPLNDPPDSQWDRLRRLFIALVSRRTPAELDLWPSQLDAAQRSLDVRDDLVVALPTSAGKTRVAELCILRALSLGQRVVFVTPLRALSAQTERTLRRTFVPLGFSVSSLYGSSGATGDDLDSLANRDVVVSTPEKLDFALRNDPSLLEKVGLVVLDEGHSIGAGEREVRYEVLVQRLLRRTDAAQRRVVCLSAMLPPGDQLDDFTAWLRQDESGQAIRSEWRPTRQRFGEIVWLGQQARLNFRVGNDRPFVPSFLTAKIPSQGRRRTPFPKDGQELTLASAWQFIAQGQTVLIYCPQRRSVEPLASEVLQLHQQGFLPSLLVGSSTVLTDAINIGSEWLGANHPAVGCLRLGVAVHHGQLPRPFLRAIEDLLRKQILRVTIASPTLAQGLNLSATTLLFHSLFRAGKLIPAEEFVNVAGRAGRAFVDVEGQVLCVDFKAELGTRWNGLVQAARFRDLRSGLLQLVLALCKKLRERTEFSVAQVVEYVTGNAAAWKPPEDTEEEPHRARDWNAELARLDAALLSLVQHDTPVEDLVNTLDNALASSLWQRSLRREDGESQALATALLRGRAGFIWRQSNATQRRGYFSAGVSFETGRLLDANASTLNQLLLEANTAFTQGRNDEAIAAVLAFARIAFTIEPFAPDELPDGWENIATDWILGRSMADLAGGMEAKTVAFIDAALVYRLVWALEAVRVRASVTGEIEDDECAGRAALAVETGTPDCCAALLIQFGVPSRIAAIKAVRDCAPGFTDASGLREWLRSELVTELMRDPKWPTEETASMWREFCDNQHNGASGRWDITPFQTPVAWCQPPPKPGTVVRVLPDSITTKPAVYSLDFARLGVMERFPQKFSEGVFLVKVGNDGKSMIGEYLGP